jgi:superfamily II DNA/RNA helicase
LLQKGYNFSMGFSELGLSPELLQAVSDAGYTIPTPIQHQAIPHVQRGRDVLGCAQTGTGKTASFVLPMIDMLAAGRARVRMPRSLILEPTRELATQVAAAFEIYGKHHRLTMALLIGGESFVDQERKLDRGVDVLIATPGRLLDLYGRGKILLSDARILVIDESDRMLDMGFIPDVERIAGLLPEPRQTLLFSATMPPEIRRLADAFLRAPVEIAVAPPASPAATVVQSLAVVQPEDKGDALRRLIGAEDVKNALADPTRPRCRRSARRYVPAQADRDAGPLSEGRDPAAGRQRCRGPRLGYSGFEPRLLLRRADPCRGLCPSHRPDRPCRTTRPVFDAGRTGRRQSRRGNRQADRSGHPNGGGPWDRRGRARDR